MELDFFQLFLETLASEMGVGKFTVLNKNDERCLFSLFAAVYELEHAIEYFYIALNTKEDYFQNGAPFIDDVSQLNFYSDRKYYLFERFARSNTIAGMRIRFRSWRRVDGTDKFEPKFMSIVDKGELTYESFLEDLLFHNVTRVSIASETLSNAFYEFFSLVKSEKYKFEDPIFVNSLFTCAAGEWLLVYWLITNFSKFNLNGGELEMVFPECPLNDPDFNKAAFIVSLSSIKNNEMIFDLAKVEDLVKVKEYFEIYFSNVYNLRGKISEIIGFYFDIDDIFVR